MGAKPLAVLDTIICGNAEKDTITSSGRRKSFAKLRFAPVFLSQF